MWAIALSPLAPCEEQEDADANIHSPACAAVVSGLIALDTPVHCGVIAQVYSVKPGYRAVGNNGLELPWLMGSVCEPGPAPQARCWL